MYQEQPGLEQTQKDFKGLMEIFNKQVFDMSKEQGDDKEYDMNKIYEVNYACIWNKPKAIRYQVKIIQKDNKLALCQFVPRNEKEEKALEKMNIDLIHTIYRLEDLS